MAEATVVESQANQPVTKAPPVVVTQETFNAWADDQLGINRGNDGPEGGQGEDNGPKAEPEKKQALDKLRPEPQEGDTDGGKVYFKGKWVDKHNFNYRLHVQTEEATKEAKEAAAKAAKEAKEAADRAAAAERDRDALRAKYEPPEKDELGPEPTPEQFKDAIEYGKALKDWTAQATRKEESLRRQQEQRAKDWDTRKAKAREEIPTFDDDVKAGENTPLSPPLIGAIYDSDQGPKLLHHLAKNPDVAKALNDMPVERMLREVGKLEAKLSIKPEPKEEAKPEKKAAPVEVSKAPAPISPIKGGGDSGVVRLKGSDAVPANMTYDEWKKKRLAGEIG